MRQKVWVRFDSLLVDLRLALRPLVFLDYILFLYSTDAQCDPTGWIDLSFLHMNTRVTGKVAAVVEVYDARYVQIPMTRPNSLTTCRPCQDGFNCTIRLKRSQLRRCLLM